MYLSRWDSCAGDYRTKHKSSEPKGWAGSSFPIKIRSRGCNTLGGGKASSALPETSPLWTPKRLVSGERTRETRRPDRAAALPVTGLPRLLTAAGGRGRAVLGGPAAAAGSPSRRRLHRARHRSAANFLPAPSLPLAPAGERRGGRPAPRLRAAPALRRRAAVPGSCRVRMDAAGEPVASAAAAAAATAVGGLPWAGARRPPARIALPSGGMWPAGAGGRPSCPRDAALRRAAFSGNLSALPSHLVPSGRSVRVFISANPEGNPRPAGLRRSPRSSPCRPQRRAAARPPPRRVPLLPGGSGRLARALRRGRDRLLVPPPAAGPAGRQGGALRVAGPLRCTPAPGSARGGRWRARGEAAAGSVGWRLGRVALPGVGVRAPSGIWRRRYTPLLKFSAYKWHVWKAPERGGASPAGHTGPEGSGQGNGLPSSEGEAFLGACFEELSWEGELPINYESSRLIPWHGESRSLPAEATAGVVLWSRSCSASKETCTRKLRFQLNSRDRTLGI